MADSFAYIDTRVAPGGTGTLGDPYDTLLNAMIGESRAIGAGDRIIFECFGDVEDNMANSLSPSVYFSGGGSIVIRGYRGDPTGFYDGDLAWSTGHYRISAPASVIRTTYPCEIDGIQTEIQNGAGNWTGCIAIEIDTTVRNCRMTADRAGAGSNNNFWGIRFATGSTIVATVENCIIFGIKQNADSGGITYWPTAGTLDVYNNTFFDCAQGIYVNTSGGILNLYNNVLGNNNDDLNDIQGTINLDYNAADDLDARGVNGVDLGGNDAAWDLAMEDPTPAAGEPNFRATTTGVLIEAGVLNSVDSKVPLDDILGDIRATANGVTIGAFETTGAAGGPITLDTGGEFDGGSPLNLRGGSIKLATGGETDGGGDIDVYPAIQPPPAGVTAAHVYAINLTRGQPLYGLDFDTVGDMMSVSKMMTCYILEREKPTMAEMQEQNTVLAGDILPSGSPTLVAGDVVDFWGLLHAAMIGSSNTAANMIGRLIGDELGGAGGVTRFVEEMNAVAAAWGMVNTTFVTAHAPSNTSTARELTILAQNTLANSQIHTLASMRWYRHFIEVFAGPSAPGLTVTNLTPRLPGYPGVIGTKLGASSATMQATLWEAPNGDKIAIGLLLASGGTGSEDDTILIMDQAQIDFPYLATPATQWTPHDLFDIIGNRGAWFDFTDAATMFSDTAGLTPAVIDGPVARINSKRGTPGTYLVQATVLNQGTLRFSDGDHWLERKAETWYQLEPAEFTDP